MKSGCIEMKRNGAGRLYFVLSTPEQSDILISQSFENKEACKECIGYLKSAFATGKGKTGQAAVMYEATADSGETFLLKVFNDEGTVYLLSLDGSGEEELKKTLCNLRCVLKNCSIVENGLL